MVACGSYHQDCCPPSATTYENQPVLGYCLCQSVLLRYCIGLQETESRRDTLVGLLSRLLSTPWL